MRTSQGLLFTSSALKVRKRHLDAQTVCERHELTSSQACKMDTSSKVNDEIQAAHTMERLREMEEALKQQTHKLEQTEVEVL